jgi:hypothetical protein
MKFSECALKLGGVRHHQCCKRAMKYLVMLHALLPANHSSVVQLVAHLTTHSTGALDSMAFIIIFSDDIECYMLASG